MRKLIKIKFIPEILTMIRQTYKIIEWLLVSLKLRNNNNKMKKRKKNFIERFEPKNLI